MKTRLLRSIILVGICAWKAAALDDAASQQAAGATAAAAVAEEGEGAPEGLEAQGVARRLKGTDASCDPAKLGAGKPLLTFKAVPAETGGEGSGTDGEGPRMELALDEEALEALSKVESKVAVVSIAGPYRTGKSYFLNYFANHVLARGSDPPKPAGEFHFDRPFRTSPTVNADGAAGETAGGAVVYHLLPACTNPLPEQPGTALLLLDTPGLMDPRRPAVEEAQMTAVLEVISSVVMYNTQAVVSRLDIEALWIGLDAAVALDHLLLLPAEGEGEGGVGLGVANRPSLVWLLQQSALEMMVTGEGEAQSAGAYVDGVLGGAMAKEALGSFFVKSNAAALPHPVNEIDRLQKLDTVSYSDLSDTYQKRVEEAVELIVPACAPKEVGGKAVDGPALAEFLRRVTKAVGIPAPDGGDSRNLPMALLEGLEARELEELETALKADWKSLALPAKADDLSAEKKTSWARALAKSSRFSAGKEEGEREGDGEGEGGAQQQRRQAFIDKLADMANSIYEEICVENAKLWLGSEIDALNKELRGPEQEQPSENQDQIDGDTGTGEDKNKDSAGEVADEGFHFPGFEDAKNLALHRLTRWRDEIAPDLALSHQTVEALVAAPEEGGNGGGQLTALHASSVEDRVDDFLNDRVEAAVKQARASFDEEMANLKAQRGAGESDVERLSEMAKETAARAIDAVQSAVGFDRAAAAVATEDWEAKVDHASKEWAGGAVAPPGGDGDANEAADGGGGGGGGGGGRNDAGDPKNDDPGGMAGGGEGADVEANADNGEAEGNGDGTSELVKTILDKFSMCIKNLKNNVGWEKGLKRCREQADIRWQEEAEMRPELGLEDKKAADLDATLQKKEEHYVDGTVKETFQKLSSELKKITSKLERPVSDRIVDRLQSDFNKKVKDQARKGGPLAREGAAGKLQRLMDDSFKKFRTNNEDEWRKTCLKAVETYKAKVEKATSFFSLAPLRYSSAGPPFEPARCLRIGVASGEIRNRHLRARDLYQRGTWGRRWLVTLALWAGAVCFAMAATLLAAGRQLQHRPVATVFLTAAGFHAVVLCLSVSEGLRLGTRLWLLVSAVVLFYTASGSTVGGKGKRGRRPTRAIWSTAGRRIVNSASGGATVMPLFRRGTGGGGGGGGNGWARHNE